MHSGLHQRAVGQVLQEQRLALAMDPVDEVAPVPGHQCGDLELRARKSLFDHGTQPIQTLPGTGRHDDCIRVLTLQHRQHVRICLIHLVDHQLLGAVSRPDLGKHLPHRRDLALRIWVRAVHHVQQEVGVHGLLQCRPERLNQVRRQVPHEPDSVGERVDATVRGGIAPCRGVEGSEERILDQDAGMSEPVEQRGLPGVGVADDGDRRDEMPSPVRSFNGAGTGHLSQPTAEHADAAVDAAPVGLNLGLTGSAATDSDSAGRPAADLSRQAGTPAAQPLLEVVQLCQLDLRLALDALGVLGKDVEDQCSPVDDLDSDPILQGAQLGRRQLAIADDGVGAGRLDDFAHLVNLATSNVGRRIRVAAALHQTVEHLGAGRFSQRLELEHGVVCVCLAAAGPDADEYHPLEAQLAVLDLGDVGQFGGQSGNST